MRIICPKCGTEYFLESDQLDEEGTPVQCSACEHTFTVFASPTETPRTPRSGARPDPAAAIPPPPPAPPRAPRAPPPPPPPAPGRSAGLFLAQGDRIYKVKDIATLQRWIVEKRVLPGDRISADGKSWDVVSDRAEMRPFFALIDQLKATKRALKEKDREVEAAAEEAERAVREAEDVRRKLSESQARPPDEIPTIRRDGPGDMAMAASGEMPDVAARSDEMLAAPPTPSPAERRAAPAPSFQPTPTDSDRSGGHPAAGPKPAPPAEHIRAVPPDHVPLPEERMPAQGKAPPAAQPGSPSDDSAGRDASFGRMQIRMSGSFDTYSSDHLPRAEGAPLLDSSAAGIDPSSSDAAIEGQASFKETRKVPVRSPTAPPAEVEGSPSSHGGAGAKVTWVDRGTGKILPPPDEDVEDEEGEEGDFDPDQTFQRHGEASRPLGGAFYLWLLLVVVLAGGGLWFLFVGPGRSFVFGGGSSTPRQVASLATPPGAEMPEPTTPEPAGTAEPLSPRPEEETPAEPGPTATERPVATPRPTAQLTPRPTAAPTPRPEPRATPSPGPRETPVHVPVSTPAAEPARGDMLAAGDRARDRGDFEGAADAYSRALEADPRNFQAALQLGWANVELGRDAAAGAAFQKALGLRSSSAEARYGLGLSYEARGLPQQAIAEYEKALDLDPAGRDAAEIRAILGRLK